MNGPSVKILSCAAACLLFAAACSSSAKKSNSGDGVAPTGGGSSAGSGSNPAYPPIPDGPIKVGLSFALSGPSAAHGALGQKGFTVALAQFKAEHPNGIDGHQIVYDTKNDQGSTTVAASVAKQFIDDKVAAVIEPSEDPAAQALQMQIWNKAKVPVVGYTFHDSKYSDGTAWPYTFNVAASPPADQGAAAANWLKAHPQYKRIALLTDDTAPQKDWSDSILNPLKTLVPADSVVTTTTIPVGAVDASTQVAKLKASNPDIVMVAVGVNLGPIWNAFHSAGWAPPILTVQNAFYDGYSSLGNLTKNAVTPALDCIASAATAIPPKVKSLMTAYVKTIGDISVNMLIFANSDSMPLEALNYAITKYHSVSPAAIKAALESLNNQGFVDNYFNLTFSPTQHFGLTGPLGAHVCQLSPLVDGAFSIPTYAP